MTNPIKKGNALENAVRSIEHAILKSAPGLAENTFLIESKKIVVVGGVRHEIDIWVQIDHGSDYKSVFIFECKNWEDSVGKNEIIVFSEKVDVVQAQKGFFVAKSFTKDAESQASKDKRLTLLRATEFPVDNLPVPFDFHFVLREKEHGNLLVMERGSKGDPSKKRQLDLKNVRCSIDGNQIDLEKYLQEWVRNCADVRLNTFPSGKLPEGSYELEAHDEREFNGDQFVIDDRAVEKLILDVTFTTRLIRPGIVSHYEVQSRGRVLSLAPVELGGGGFIQVGFIAKPTGA
jgi:hypothetical protein